MIKSGKEGDFYWLEVSESIYSLGNFISNHKGLLLNKNLVINCFDSGPLSLTQEEKRRGWLDKEGHVCIDNLDSNEIGKLPFDQYDQWLLYDEVYQFESMHSYVNYDPFSLALSEDVLLNKFWKELTQVNPHSFILNGTFFIYGAKDLAEIGLLYKSILGSI